MIVVVDYGLGNLGSIGNMLKKIGAEAVVTSDPGKIAAADKLILPGVGAFDNGMRNLNDLGITGLLNKKVLEEKTPILGICLGMQLFTNGSAEGGQPGLGWIDAEALKFDMTGLARRFTVPHMGWEYVRQQKESKLWENMYEDPRFYFVHSYYVRCNNPSDVLLSTHYAQDYVSGFERENIVGVQFHPEKSHKYGMQLFSNFIRNY